MLTCFECGILAWTGNTVRLIPKQHAGIPSQWSNDPFKHMYFFPIFSSSQSLYDKHAAEGCGCPPSRWPSLRPPRWWTAPCLRSHRRLGHLALSRCRPACFICGAMRLSDTRRGRAPPIWRCCWCQWCWWKVGCRRKTWWNAAQKHPRCSLCVIFIVCLFVCFYRKIVSLGWKRWSSLNLFDSLLFSLFAWRTLNRIFQDL